MKTKKPDSPDGRHERIVALLADELSPKEAAELRRLLESDPALMAYYNRMRRTMGLVRATAAAASKESPRLSDSRRAAVLARLKQPPARKTFTAPRRKLDWVVPLALAASVIALLGGALVMPSFVRSKQPHLMVALSGSGEHIPARQIDTAETSWFDDEAKGRGVVRGISPRFMSEAAKPNELATELKDLDASMPAGEGVTRFSRAQAADAYDSREQWHDPAPESGATATREYRSRQLLSDDKAVRDGIDNFGLNENLIEQRRGTVPAPTAPPQQGAQAGYAISGRVPSTFDVNQDAAAKPNLNLFLAQQEVVANQASDFRFFSNTEQSGGIGGGGQGGGGGFGNRGGSAISGVEQVPMLGDVPDAGTVFFGGTFRSGVRDEQRSVSSDYAFTPSINPSTGLPSLALTERFAQQTTEDSLGLNVPRSNVEQGIAKFEPAPAPNMESRAGLIAGVALTQPSSSDLATIVNGAVDSVGVAGRASTLSERQWSAPRADPSATPVQEESRSMGRVSGSKRKEAVAPPVALAMPTESEISRRLSEVDAVDRLAAPAPVPQAAKPMAPSRSRSLDLKPNAEASEGEQLARKSERGATGPEDKKAAPEHAEKIVLGQELSLLPGIVTNGVAAITAEAKFAKIEQNEALAKQVKGVEVLQAATADSAAILAKRPAPVPTAPLPEVETRVNAFSTISLNVSDVSFKLAAASLAQGQLPEPGSVRSEEFVNAMEYHDSPPRAEERVTLAWDQARHPLTHNRDLLRLSVQTAAWGREQGRPLNLVLLLDNSGSMERADRVLILQQALYVLAGQLTERDRISVVAFARTPRLWVDGLAGGKAEELLQRVGRLNPEGGTNLEAALALGYETAEKHFMPNGINRVILMTDGAANLGNVNPDVLRQRVERERKKQIALDCFGVGWEGFNDALLEELSRNGDGRYGFLNSPAEAATEFAGQLAGALRVAASDVKVQIEFNPDRVVTYRQIGYEKHQLTKEQFRDNTVDAAEIGAAESGTALYAIQVNQKGTGPLGVARVRYKVPETGRYEEREWLLSYTGGVAPLETAPASMRLAAVAGMFAEWLAQNPYSAGVDLGSLQRYMDGVRQAYPRDERVGQLHAMIEQARRIR